jgi:HEAT repeat protein
MNTHDPRDVRARFLTAVERVPSDADGAARLCAACVLALPVRHAAIGALGALGDRQSEALLQGLAKHGSSDRTGKAAEEALAALRAKQPLVPGEVTELRSQVRKLEESQHKLLEKVDDLERRLKAKVEPAAAPPAPAG